MHELRKKAFLGAAISLFGLSCALFLAAQACTLAELPKDNGPCATPSKCPADPPPTAAEMDTCERALGSPCAAEYRALLDCVARSQVCGPAGNTNPDALRAACDREDTAYGNCVPTLPDSSAPTSPLDASVMGDR